MKKTESKNEQVAVVAAVIENTSGEIFLQQRTHAWQEIDLKWEFPGGKIEFGEDPIDAIRREAAEETNFRIEVLRLLPKVYSNLYEDRKVQVIILSYHCRIISGEYKPEAGKVVTGKFFGIADIDYKNCLGYTKEIIELLKK